MRFVIALLLGLSALCASAQDARTAIERQRASVDRQGTSVSDRQQASAARQRAAIRARLKPAADNDPEPFFIVPWPDLPPPLGAAAGAGCEPVAPEQIAPLVERVSKREGLAPGLLSAVIEKESAFRPCAVSAKGALGLMQLMPETADQLGVTDPFDPVENLSAGAKFLKQMLTRYGGNVRVALAAYNAGPSRIDAAAGIPRIPETVDYVSAILRRIELPAHVEAVR